MKSISFVVSALLLSSASTCFAAEKIDRPCRDSLEASAQEGDPLLPLCYEEPQPKPPKTTYSAGQWKPNLLLASLNGNDYFDLVIHKGPGFYSDPFPYCDSSERGNEISMPAFTINGNHVLLSINCVTGERTMFDGKITRSGVAEMRAIRRNGGQDHNIQGWLVRNISYQIWRYENQ